jgi:hypothetical protein
MYSIRHDILIVLPYRPTTVEKLEEAIDQGVLVVCAYLHVMCAYLQEQDMCAYLQEHVSFDTNMFVLI